MLIPSAFPCVDYLLLQKPRESKGRRIISYWLESTDILSSRVTSTTLWKIHSPRPALAWPISFQRGIRKEFSGLGVKRQLQTGLNLGLEGFATAIQKNSPPLNKKPNSPNKKKTSAPPIKTENLFNWKIKLPKPTVTWTSYFIRNLSMRTTVMTARTSLNNKRLESNNWSLHLHKCQTNIVLGKWEEAINWGCRFSGLGNSHVHLNLIDCQENKIITSAMKQTLQSKYFQKVAMKAQIVTPHIATHTHFPTGRLNCRFTGSPTIMN